MRAAMRGYDLDHVRDLQFGGEDASDNLQWVERSENRPVGAQAKVHRMKFDYDRAQNLEFMDEQSRVDMVSRINC